MPEWLTIAAAAWLAIGGCALAWLLGDEDVRADVASMPAADQVAYVLLNVVLWPVLAWEFWQEIR